jgi:hypothetical protein
MSHIATLSFSFLYTKGSVYLDTFYKASQTNVYISAQYRCVSIYQGSR